MRLCGPRGRWRGWPRAQVPPVANTPRRFTADGLAVIPAPMTLVTNPRLDTLLAPLHLVFSRRSC